MKNPTGKDRTSLPVGILVYLAKSRQAPRIMTERCRPLSLFEELERATIHCLLGPDSAVRGRPTASSTPMASDCTSLRCGHLAAATTKETFVTEQCNDLIPGKHLAYDVWPLLSRLWATVLQAVVACCFVFHGVRC